MTTFLLVRHAAHDLLGRALAGRAEGVGLNERGRAQARELASRLEGIPVNAVYSSPRRRALETAEPMAVSRGVAIQQCGEFDEIDFGQWTGRSFDQLRDEQPGWRTWVEHRSVACPPGGEPFAEVCSRALGGIERLSQLHPRQQVLIVSHGDVIKAVVASVLGMSLDHLERFDVLPASLSVLAVEGDWRQVKLLNGSPPAPA